MIEPVKCISWRPADQSRNVQVESPKGVYLISDNVGKRQTNETSQTEPKPTKTLADDVPQWKQITGALTVSWLNFIIGYSTGFVSPALNAMNNQKNFRVTENEISWIGSLMPLFALVGSTIGGFTLDKFGRKWTIILGGAPFLPSFILTYMAGKKVWLVMVGRALAGLATGLSTVSVPVYLGELTGPKVRGFYGLLPTTCGNLGILVATLLGLPESLRLLALVGIIGILPFFGMIFFLVESPTWLAAQKKADLENIMIKKDSEKEGRTKCFSTGEDGMCRREYVLPFVICMGMHIIQQFCGINAVITYATQIFEKMKGTIDPLLSSIIISIVNVLSTLLANFLVDKIGRKRLMYWSLAMLLLSNIVLSGFYLCQRLGHAWVLHVDWVPLGAFAVFILGFSLGAGPIPWLILGEVLPEKIRGATASFVTAAHWVFTFLVTKTFVDISERFGSHIPFAGYAIICFLGLLGMEIVPETAGKTLDEIQNKLKRKKKKGSSKTALQDTTVHKVSPMC